MALKLNCNIRDGPKKNFLNLNLFKYGICISTFIIKISLI